MRARNRGADVEWLPSYAREFNAVEQVWNHTRHSDLPDLARAIYGNLANLCVPPSARPKLNRSCYALSLARQSWHSEYRPFH